MDCGAGVDGGGGDAQRCHRRDREGWLVMASSARWAAELDGLKTKQRAAKQSKPLPFGGP
eukprot:scaffold113_cov96-Isochrysis_galbana.AAC.1